MEHGRSDDHGFNVYIIQPEQYSPDYELQADGISKWLAERLAAIHDHIGTSSSQEIASYLANGIPVLNTGEVHISDEHPGTSPSLIMNEHQQQIDCIVTIDPSSLNSSLQAVAEHDNGSLLCHLGSHAIGNKQGTYGSEIETAVWNLSEYLWRKNVPKQPTSYSIQTKLI